MTDQTPSDEIRKGLSGDDPGVARRARRIASGFRPNETYDQLIALRDEGNPSWGDLDRGTQLRCAMYESQREIAAAYGTDNPPPTA